MWTLSTVVKNVPIRVKKFRVKQFSKNIYKIIYKFWKILRKLLWLERYCNCQNEIEKNVDSTFENIQNIRLCITNLHQKLKMYQKCIKNVSNSHCSLSLPVYIIFYHSKMLKFRGKFRIDNFPSQWRRNDIFSRNYFWLDNRKMINSNKNDNNKNNN